MEFKTISITKFKVSLTRLCRSVKAGKIELIVTYYNQPIFQVISLPNPNDAVRCSFGDVRDRTPQFLDLIESKETVALVSKRKLFVMCIKL